MTGKERGLAALAGEKTDRIAGYTPTVACDVASELLGREVNVGSSRMWFRAAQALLRGEVAFAEFSAQVDDDLIALARALGDDVIRRGWRLERKPARQLDEYHLLYGDPDGVWEKWEFDPRCQTYGMVETNAPAAEPEDWPKKARRAAAGLPAQLEKIRAGHGDWEAAMQRRVGDEFLILGAGGSFSVGVDVPSMMACLLEPGAVADLLDCQLEIARAGADASRERGIAVLLGGGDMADNSGTMYSPEIFRELMLPRLRSFSDYCRARGLHYVWRSDGKTWAIADDLFLDARIAGYGEVDFNAGMTAAALRERYPELVLWANGAGDTIRRGTPDAVYAHGVEILRGGGPTRHFYGCSNTILAGTPVENVRAFFRAKETFRW